MRPDDLQELLRRQPFQPFRLHLTTGVVLEVRHPELALVARSVVVVQVPAANYPFTITLRRVIVVLLHIVLVDFLEPPVPPSTN
jgi:hypothetical protein